MSKINLLPLLNYISADDYDTWYKVGMALKYEGYSLNDWIEWSQTSTEYASEAPQACEEKWNIFTSAPTKNPITGAFITVEAKKSGWHSNHSSMPNQSPQQTQQGLERPTNWDGTKDAVTFLQVLFKPNEIVTYNTRAGQRKDSNKYDPVDNGNSFHTAQGLIDYLQKVSNTNKALGNYNPQAGVWIRVNPMDGKGVSDNNVTDFRYTLVESDQIPIEKQYYLIKALNLPVATLTNTGGKSLHAIVRIDARNAEEYRQRVEYLYSILEINHFNQDTNDKNPSRLTRFPGFQRGDAYQWLVATNLGAKSWNEWYQSMKSPKEPLSLEAVKVAKTIEHSKNADQWRWYLTTDFHDCNTITQWDGQTKPFKRYGQELSCCGMLAYWTNQALGTWDKNVINELFIHTRLFKPDWFKVEGKQLYGKKIITKAIAYKQGHASNGYHLNLSKIATEFMNASWDNIPEGK